ncbi:MAG: carboxypeptidase-like regulatory domain-containing protein [Halobacteriales archaeon]|nr:carboxypeptidase-like regulatory domain-containing protein [Halobacteriales archaeon]
MRIFAMAAALLCCTVVLSGCSGGKDTPAPDQLATGRGGISGLLIDDIYRPVAGGLILIQGIGLTATTDDLGQFSFVDVLPGSYILLATAPNHEASPVTVDVVAGQYAEPEIVARRTFSVDGATVTTQYSFFLPCATTALVYATTSNCSADLSGDTYRSGVHKLNFTGFNVTYLVVETKFNSKSSFLITLRHDDGSSGGGDEWAQGRSNGTDYVRVLLQKGVAQPGEKLWRNEKSKPMEVVPFYLGEEGDTIYGTTGVDTFGAGHKFAIKGSIIVTAFVGAPAVEVADYHVLGPSA